MTIDLNSYDGLTLRATNCVESVALFTDVQLAALAGYTLDRGILEYLLGEMLVRTWLYRGQTSQLQTAIDHLAKQLELSSFVSQFRRTVHPLRERRWPIEDEIIRDAFGIETTLAMEQERFWSFVERRVCGFLTCDGIIPAIIAGDAIAIPFTIRQGRDLGKILDADGRSIDAWIGESHELWKTLGRRFGVRLACAFGDHAAFRNGKPLVSGGSFALPLLFGASRSEIEDIHPLDVICTGAVLHDELREIDGRDEKHLLANRIGARWFVAPGTGKPWLLSPGRPVKQALGMILKEIGASESQIAACTRRVFAEREEVRFARAIQELTLYFVGRDEQIRQLLEWIESKEGGGYAWIEGKAGCGKSAFMAALSRHSSEFPTLFSISYFFDPKWTRSRREDDFFRHASEQIAAEYGLDFDQVRYEDPEEQLRFALKNLTSESSRLIFMLDGVDEAEGPLDALVSLAKEFGQCIWIFAGQHTDKTNVVSELPSIKRFSLGGLNREAMTTMITSVARDMSEQLVEAIVGKAEGLPQYAKLVLDDWKVDGNALNPEKLPDGLPEYYRRIIERLRTGGDFTQQWRGDVTNILALLATARRRTPLTAASVTAMLARYVRSYSVDEVAAALKACEPILRSMRPDIDDDQLQWTFSHNSFRDFILKDDSMLALRDSAQQAWADVCRAWDAKELEDGVRAYALRFLAEELIDANDLGGVITLAKNPRFLDAQTLSLGPRFSLETMARGINFALAAGNLKDAAALTLERSKRAEHSYTESPFTAMRTRKYQWALELIGRIENQNERTLWHLALAAWHMNGKRPYLAAQILDETIPRDALYEKLVGGASMCAGLLMSLLINVRTRRFQWDRFISRLDDTSKREISPLLVNHVRTSIHLVRRVLASISEPDLRNNARKDVIRELAVSNPNEAELQLAHFGREFDRAFGAIEVVAAFARRKQWPQVKRVMATYMPQEAARQRAQAFAYIAVELSRAGLRRDSKNAYLDGLDAINALASKPDQQAKAYAEFGVIQAEAGFLPQADKAFESALEIATNLKGSHIYRAKCFTALVASFSIATEYSPEWFPFVKRATSQANDELDRSDGGEVDPTRLRLVRALGRNGHFDLANWVAGAIHDSELRTEAMARLFSYYIRLGRPAPRQLVQRLEKTSRFDSRILIHSLIALEKVKENRSAALVEICKHLRYPTAQWRTKHWGPARVLSEAAVVLSQHGDRRAPRLLEAATRSLDGIPVHERGRYLVDLATCNAECGNVENAREMFLHARQCIVNTKNEKSKVDLWAEIESAERHWHLEPRPDSTTDGTVFEYVYAIGNENNTLAHKLTLLNELVTPMAEAGFYRELEQICRFAIAHLEDDRFLQKPATRSELAGAFAAKLSKSALTLNGFPEWATRFVEVCRRIQAEHRVSMPDDSIRAEVLLKAADGEFAEAITAAQRIGVGEKRSIVFRDLAIRAVRLGDCSQALHLSTRITHGRSQHLPDIARELVERAVRADAPFLYRLTVICSEYSDAAYRITSSLLRFHKPQPDEVVDILRACALLNGISFPEADSANQ